MIINMLLKSHGALDSFHSASFPILAGGILIIVKLNDREMTSEISSTLIPNRGYSKSVHGNILNNANSISRCEVYATN